MRYYKKVDIFLYVFMLEHFSSFCSTGRDTFLTDECPVNLCTISFTDSDADLVIFKEDFANRFTMPSFQRPLNQLWMIYMLENPLHTHIFGVRDGLLMKTLIGMSMCKKNFAAPKQKCVQLDCHLPLRLNHNNTLWTVAILQ